MKQPGIVVGLGEILWDIFPDGPRFGGAPANFACSAAQLGKDLARVSMASSVGKDDFGRLAIEALHKHNVDTSCVASLDRPTGRVFVKLDSAGRANYEFAADSAWDYLPWSTELEQLALRTSTVCFGTLGQRSEPSRSTIKQFVSTTPLSALRIFDVNLRPPFFNESVILESLNLANVLKLNDEELTVLASVCGLSGLAIDMMQQLAGRFCLQCVALTRGPDGAILIRGNEISEQSGAATQVVDTVGAGDAFTAILALGLLDGGDLETINRNACIVSAFVCSQPGATPAIPADLIAESRS